jgi:hypothetical protein
MDVTITIPADVARKLGHYVYLLINPLDKSIFYVGKGRGKRVLAHLQDARRSRKTGVLNRIRAAGETPGIDILAHGLRNEEMAFRIEAGVIDVLGLPALTNEIRGWETKKFGRLPLKDIVALYRKKRITIKEPGIVIRINRLYRPGMTPTELYDATRGVWVVGPQREKAKYAFAIFGGVIREVYEIAHWLPAGSTLSTRSPGDIRAPGRWEFVGRVAPERLRKRYLGRYVGHTFRQGSQNPISYVNLGTSGR